MKAIFKDLIWFVTVLFILVAVRIYVVTPIKIQGESMMPTLVDGEKALAYKLGDIHRFDVVPLVAPDDPSLNYVKRVIGLPGDKVAYKNDQLYINDQPLSEDYLNQYKNEWHQAGNAVPLTPDFTLSELTDHDTVPPNTYFVLGDNRQVSKDSRFPEVGFIPKENIIGKAKVTIWPPSEWGLIE